ncbi:unnamed protein product, partial [Mesorhabditis spiculigera]
MMHLEAGLLLCLLAGVMAVEDSANPAVPENVFPDYEQPERTSDSSLGEVSESDREKRVVRNPYSWMAQRDRGTRDRRAIRNPYSWMAQRKDDEPLNARYNMARYNAKRAMGSLRGSLRNFYVPRNPYSWQYTNKRGIIRNPYSWQKGKH